MADLDSTEIISGDASLVEETSSTDTVGFLSLISIDE